MIKRKSKRSRPVRRNIVRVLFFLNALAWLGYSVYVVLDMVKNANGLSAVYVGLFMLGNAGVMIWSGIMLGKPQKWGYYFAIVFVFLNIILILNVSSGFFDTITFILDVIILLMLIFLRKEYLS